MKKTLGFLMLLVFALSINITFAQKNVSIKGKIVNGEFTIAYIDNIMQEKRLDSTKIAANGEFLMKTQIEKTDFYKIYFDETTYIVLILTPGEDVTLSVDAKDLYKPQISGSKHSELVYTTLKQTQEYDKKVEDYKLQVQKEKKEQLRKMINDNSTSLACLFFIDQLDINEDFELFQKLSDGLSKDHSDNTLVADLNKKVKSRSKLSVGSVAPEIDLPNVEGKNIKLSSLKGKIVLIDFWASWCRPCRNESPNMVKLYEKYHAKGLEIYSVSLDESKEAWTGAIEKDGLGKWIHVSDLKYWDSQAGQDYGVEGIPFTVLIDKNGKIITKELRGEDLEKKIEEVLK